MNRDSLKELRTNIEDIEVTWDYEQTYNDLYNTCIEYQNNTQDYEVDLESPFEDIYSYDVIEDIAKSELERGGLVRLYYFMGNVNFDTQDVIRINAYGNCEEIHKDDLELLKENILDNIDLVLNKSEELEI